MCNFRELCLKDSATRLAIFVFTRVTTIKCNLEDFNNFFLLYPELSETVRNKVQIS